MALPMLALASLSAPSMAQERIGNVELVRAAIAASAAGATADLARIVDDGSEAEQMGMNHIALGAADFSPPADCQSPSAKIEEIRPKMVLMSWLCGGKFSGVRKTALISERRIVAVLGDVTQGGN